MEVRCHIMRCRGMPVLGLEGSFDLHSAPQVRQMLLACLKREPNLVVLMSDVTHLDSSGQASLVEAFQISRKQGGRMALAAVSPAVFNALQLSRLDQVFPLFPSLEEALNGLKEQP